MAERKFVRVREHVKSMPKSHETKQRSENTSDSPRVYSPLGPHFGILKRERNKDFVRRYKREIHKF